MKYFTADVLRGNLEIGAFKGGRSIWPKISGRRRPTTPSSYRKTTEWTQKVPSSGSSTTFLNISAVWANFCTKFYTNVKQKIYTLPPSLVEIYMTRGSPIAERPRCRVRYSFRHGHYRSIFNHCDIIGWKSIEFGEKTQNNGYYGVQGHSRSSGRYQSKARMRFPISH